MSTPPINVQPAPPLIPPNRRRTWGMIAGGVIGFCVLCSVFSLIYSASPAGQAVYATKTAETRLHATRTASVPTATVAPNATPVPTQAPPTARPTLAPRPTATVPPSATPFPTFTPWVPPTCVPGERLGALCKDGYKDLEHTGSGACSGHGGVAEWLICP